MERWKYFAIGHAQHTVCNPLSESKLDEGIELLGVPSNGRVLDVGCGKAELLVRCVRRFGCEGLGIDLSPPFVAEARARVQAVGLSERILIREGDGRAHGEQAGSFDAACCLGASWIWDGFEPTLRALLALTRDGGVVLVGEPFWRRPPSAAYLEATGWSADSFGTHAGNVATGCALGLRILHTIVSSEDDFDRYEGYQWHATERYAERAPQDPDLPDLLETMRRSRESYLRWGREELGWALYLFSKPKPSPGDAYSR